VEPPEVFFNRRYGEPGYAYGTEPNDFVREVADRIPAGPVLCLGEGQGRNAVYLAGCGHAVTAMDVASVGLACAQALARERGVRLTTAVGDLATFRIAPAAWSGIVSTFVHLPTELRARVHRGVVAGLAPGGVYVLEVYGPRQLEFRTGGPETPERLAAVGTLVAELAGPDCEIAREVERDVMEGRYHTGRAATVQILARRPRG
jgi:SAM-dependent methyltransferase